MSPWNRRYRNPFIIIVIIIIIIIIIINLFISYLFYLYIYSVLFISRTSFVFNY